MSKLSVSNIDLRTSVDSYYLSSNRYLDFHRADVIVVYVCGRFHSLSQRPMVGQHTAFYRKCLIGWLLN